MSSVDIWEKTFTIDLLTHDRQCRGALVWNPASRQDVRLGQADDPLRRAAQGGCTARRPIPDIATADGQAMAFRAGAELRDMELMQFHPTVLYIAGSSRHLISEAVRGEGGHLVDATGHRFMPDYDPRTELAPRDIVSRAITEQMEKTRHPCVYLDLRHLPEALIAERFPHIGQVCREFGLDLAQDLIPVRPGAHYMIGGVTVDLDGRTTLPGLWAAGEVTSSGLHGRTGWRRTACWKGCSSACAAASVRRAAALQIADDFLRPAGSLRAATNRAMRTEELNLVDLRNSLTSLMGRHVGIRRDAEGLAAAAQQVEFWDRYVGRAEFHTVEGWELQNMLLVARLMIASALARTESRGVHFRSDYPETSAGPGEHVTIRGL